MAAKNPLPPKQPVKESNPSVKETKPSSKKTQQSAKKTEQSAKKKSSSSVKISDIMPDSWKISGPCVSEEAIRKQVEKRSRYLEQKFASVKKEYDNLPDGYLKAKKHGNGWQYYWREREPGTKWKYLKRGEKEFAEEVAQKVYDRRVLDAAKKELDSYQKIRFPKDRKGYPIINRATAEGQFETLPKGIQIMVHPIEETDVQFYERWKSKPYSQKDFYEGSPVFHSQLGECMRSKSEIMIADLLTKNHIPYLYEKPLNLKGFGIIYPDFTLLDFKKRREVYWEHLGLMDDSAYANSAIKKIFAFKANSIYPGSRLFLTFETSQFPLDTSQIMAEIGLLDNCVLSNE